MSNALRGECNQTLGVSPTAGFWDYRKQQVRDSGNNCAIVLARTEPMAWHELKGSHYR
ncbi:hypothetical protein BDK62_12440 [Halomonas alkaliantarctica]|nr:hypothetical protein BDK62_12440 [Halomonas alkaliantarctica]